ncbi:MAG: FAD-dependent oxidoreductase, partial [Xanthomonadales bacterium]|nr:FAD-dependent oxidoreductase [Gammaproteobacteria bacterium]NNK03367.1 FAD-dependent oxidoreductase [Xanthomonadales bacterium]
MHVVVLGAGVIGVTTAYYLAKRGHEVTVVERAEKLADGASGGNGGQLSYSFTDAMAGPALVPKLPGIIAGLNPAFHVRPVPSAALIRWGLSFLSQCRKSRHQANTVEILKLALRSGELMDDLRASTGLEFSHRRAGKLVMLSGEPGLSEAREACELKRQFGCDARVITPEQAIEIEPALLNMDNDYSGAVYSESDEVGDTLAFTAGLGQWLSENHGTEFQMKTTVERIVTENGQLAAVHTDRGVHTPGAVVVCLGAWTNRILAPLGIRTNIYPMRGYSITLPVTGGSNSVSITDLASKTVFSRLGDQVRIAGFADFVDFRTAKDESRTRDLLQTARRTAPKIADFSFKPAGEWGGFR